MTKKMFKLVSPCKGKGDKTYWKDCGRGFENHDSSLSLHLDAFPVNGKLCVFEMTEEDFRRRDGARAEPRDHVPPSSSLDPLSPPDHQDSIPF